MEEFRMRRWVRMTWLGWMLGIVLTIVAALAGEAVGWSESQAVVGAGMGAGVGIMQGRVFAGFPLSRGAWAVASSAGLAAPFLVFDVLRGAGYEPPYSLYVSVAMGGFTAGFWQSNLLRSTVRRPWMWALGSLAGWSLAAASVAAADRLPKVLSLRGLSGAAIYLAVTLGGGLLLGLVTGFLMHRLNRRETVARTA